MQEAPTFVFPGHIFDIPQWLLSDLIELMNNLLYKILHLQTWKGWTISINERDLIHSFLSYCWEVPWSNNHINRMFPKSKFDPSRVVQSAGKYQQSLFFHIWGKIEIVVLCDHLIRKLKLKELYLLWYHVDSWEPPHQKLTQREMSTSLYMF